MYLCGVNNGGIPGQSSGGGVQGVLERDWLPPCLHSEVLILRRDHTHQDGGHLCGSAHHTHDTDRGSAVWFSQSHAWQGRGGQPCGSAHHTHEGRGVSHVVRPVTPVTRPTLYLSSTQSVSCFLVGGGLNPLQSLLTDLLVILLVGGTQRQCSATALGRLITSHELI